MGFRLLFITLLFAVLNSLSAESDWRKAAELRRNSEYSQAEKLLKKYSSPARFDSLKTTEKIEFLRGLLELAHVKALQDDVSGSLALLNWAEGRSDEYQRSIACVKYAEILLDLGEFERAQGYLKNADEIIRKRVANEDTGIAIGQGSETADTGAVWRGLRDQSDALKAEIEAEAMKKKFGATYGNYVKLRRLQNLVKRSGTPRYLKEAQKVADEIIETDPASQFAAAAGYLKGEILASRLKENSPKKEIKEVKDYLNRFVKQQPDGLYRGEALMLLGKISLEIEWNAKEAEKYYSQALAWFRKAREKRDALSLYAAMNDDLKKQSTPTQKPTTLNQWKRIVYHDEDPLKLYNTANAPVWYVDDKEKECIYPLGFLSFANGDYDKAWQYWSEIIKLDSDQRRMDSVNFPNIIMRLRIACMQKRMFFNEKQRNLFSNDNKLRILLGELLFLEEKFSFSKNIFLSIVNDPKSSDMDKAAAYIVLGNYIAMSGKDVHSKKDRLAILNKYYIKALKLARKTALQEIALKNCGFYLSASSETYLLALPYFKEYIRIFPDSLDIENIIFKLGFLSAQSGDIKTAKVSMKKLKNQKMIKILNHIIKEKEEKENGK